MRNEHIAWADLLKEVVSGPCCYKRVEIQTKLATSLKNRSDCGCHNLGIFGTSHNGCFM